MKYRALFLAAGIVLTSLMGSIGVRPVGAQAIDASSSIVIYQLQTAGGGSGTATEEVVLLLNAGNADVDITNWCIEYSSGNDNTGFRACLEPPDSKTQLWLPVAGMVSFATEAFMLSHPGFTSDVIMSGGMNSSTGHLRLLDSQTVEIDKVGWGSAVSPEGTAVPAHATGMVLSRNVLAEDIDTDDNSVDFSENLIAPIITSDTYEVEVVIDQCPNIEGVQAELPDGHLFNSDNDCVYDMCPTIIGLQNEVPEGYFLNEQDECEQLPLEDATIFITEVYPNSPSYDTGNEFVELYNPNDREVFLEGYRIEVGPSYMNSYALPSIYLPPKSYSAFSDEETGLVLPNATGVALRLISPAGSVVSESTMYTNAPEDESWALIENTWVYTNQITRAAQNKPFLLPTVDEEEGVTSVYAPCPEGKFRNPLTNRCKLINSTTSQLVPCGADEFRNPETNRCKKIASTSSSLVPCGEGQERNPETNRCRNVAVLSSTNSSLTNITDVQPVATEGSLNWPIIVLALLGTIGYMIYEWRSELQQFVRHHRVRA